MLAVMGGDGMVHLGINRRRAPLDREPTDARADPGRHRQRPVSGLGMDPGPGGRGRGPSPPVHPPDRRWQVSDALRRWGAGHRLRRAGQRSRERDDLARGTSGTPSPRSSSSAVRPAARTGWSSTARCASSMRCCVAVGNTASYGGGMQICPNADPSDGLLDVTIIHPVGRVKLLRLLPDDVLRAVRPRPLRRAVAGRREVDGSRDRGWSVFGDGELLAAPPR